MAEVDEATAELGKLSQKVLLGKNREKFLEMVAEEHPDLNLPEVNAKKAVDAATAPLKKKIEDLEAQNTKAESMARLEERRKPLRAKGYDAKRIEAVEKFMHEKGILNHEIASNLMEQEEAAAAPRVGAHSYSPVTLPTGEDKSDNSSQLYKNPRGYSRGLAHSLIDDLSKGKRI